MLETGDSVGLQHNKQETPTCEFSLSSGTVEDGESMQKIFKMPCLLILFTLLITTVLSAQIDGPCSDCHTMHNSQDGSAMNYDGSVEPNLQLLRTATCIGCHAQPAGMNMVNGIPQVMHADPIDLAAGNFAYVNGAKGSGASQTKGHNVVDILPQDTIHNYPPGGPFKNSPAGIVHPDTMPEQFTCAGLYGCHGNAHIIDPLLSIRGAHHGNIGNKPFGTTVADSYRFLLGVNGLEAGDLQNLDSSNHNEYIMDDHQLPGFPTQSSCGWCHGPENPWHGNSGEVLEPGSGMSNLCMRCHPAMHSWIDRNSAWYRHPNNVPIPNRGEYAAYTVYNVDALVSRRTLPDVASPIVTPGTDAWDRGQDHVFCLSCHKAHATDYPDILRWDYTTIVAGGGNGGEGCFICHTTKDD